ncbi:MAG: PmbA/TldA family metallopeptidase, partial [Actinomycetes bacterium]
MPELDESFLALPLRALADAALSRAREFGATHADVRVQRAAHASRSWRDGALETSADRYDLGLAVRVVHGGAWGFAADIVLTADSAARLAERAVATARVARALTAY